MLPLLEGMNCFAGQYYPLEEGRKWEYQTFQKDLRGIGTERFNWGRTAAEGPFRGIAHVEVEGVDWYAPNIGWVKGILTEQTNDLQLGWPGHQMIHQLIKFTNTLNPTNHSASIKVVD